MVWVVLSESCNSFFSGVNLGLCFRTAQGAELNKVNKQINPLQYKSVTSWCNQAETLLALCPYLPTEKDQPTQSIEQPTNQQTNCTNILNKQF